MFINTLKTGLLFFILTALVLGGGYAIGGQNGLVFALVMAGVMNFIGFFFSDKIALMSMSAQEVGPEHPLYRIVGRLAQRANLPMPRVYISPHDAPNAFATGRNPGNAAVCATEGLLRLLDENEVAGVMGHELSHVRHRDILLQTIAATVAGAISYLGYMFMFGGGRSSNDREGGNPIAGLLFLILGPIAAGLIQMAISRQREYAADTGGAELCGDPMYLASALEKLEMAAKGIPLDTNPAFNSMFIIEPFNPMASAAQLFMTHPPTEKRIMNLLGRPSTGLHRL
ncbi:MAG: zinc metalloprotease HtpX [Tepidisphaeraceae bacterium]|jgi:heat shock protein HtpX